LQKNPVAFATGAGLFFLKKFVLFEQGRSCAY